MNTFLIIADDFTGALDTGVSFSSGHSNVKVSVNWDCDFQEIDKDVSVIVLDTETRHIPPTEAADRVRSIVSKARKAGITNIMKKTDSALRGNIGSELTSLLMESGQKILHFFPAFPELGRTTERGIHYINGIPVSDSSFGKDPFEPVRHSMVADIIREQSAIPVIEESNGSLLMESTEPVIVIYDSRSKDDLHRYAKQISNYKGSLCIAGCGGLAKSLSQCNPSKVNQHMGSGSSGNVLSESGLLIACGSVNPATQKQMDYAEEHHFKRIRLNPEQKLQPGYFSTKEGKEWLRRWKELCISNKHCIFDTNDLHEEEGTLHYAHQIGITKEEMRIRITKSLGQVTRMLLDEGIKKTLFVTGGDALFGFLQEIGVDTLYPVRELTTGTVLSEFVYHGTTYYLISKSGGFGQKELLVELARQ